MALSMLELHDSSGDRMLRLGLSIMKTFRVSTVGQKMPPFSPTMVVLPTQSFARLDEQKFRAEPDVLTTETRLIHRQTWEEFGDEPFGLIVRHPVHATPGLVIIELDDRIVELTNHMPDSLQCLGFGHLLIEIREECMREFVDILIYMQTFVRLGRTGLPCHGMLGMEHLSDPMPRPP